MSYDAIIGATLSGLYTPRWSGTADFLAQLEAEPQASAAAGTPSVAAPVTAGRSPAFGDYPQFEAFAAVPCSETDNPTAFSAWGRAADKAAVRYPHFGRYWTWDSSVCDVWPARDADRYTGPWRRRRRTRSWSRATTTTPPLPMRSAVTASRLLKNARLISYAGWGHKAYLTVGHTCVEEAVTRYLVTNTLPARGMVYQPQGTPFDAPGDVTLPIPPQTPAF